jgi:hypothetical protein
MNPLLMWMRTNQVSQRDLVQRLEKIVTQPAIWKWLQPGAIPPSRRHIDIERVTDGAVTEADWAAYKLLLMRGCR